MSHLINLPPNFIAELIKYTWWGMVFILSLTWPHLIFDFVTELFFNTLKRNLRRKKIS